MKTRGAQYFSACSVFACVALSIACSGSESGNASGGGPSVLGGATSQGGASNGGVTSRGGSTASGGVTPSGGSTSSSGAPAGGTPSAGSANGGTSTGGAGTNQGGSSSGGSAGTTSGGAPTAGSGGMTTSPFGFACPDAGTLSGSPLPSGATASQIANSPPKDMVNQYDFFNIEGPVWIGGSLYYSEVKATDSSARIFQLSGESSSVFIENSGSNGMAVDKDDNLVTANQGVGGIVRFELPSKAKTTLVATYDNKRFNCPNDLVYRSDGTLYFTDPDFQNSSRPQGATRTYQLPPNATTATVIAADYGNNPNGVTLSLDEKTLFVGGPSGVKQYAIDANGKVADMGTSFGTALSSNSDGMTLDCAGNLYVAIPNTNTIVVVDKMGKPVANSPLKVNGTNAVTNVAFGGDDRKTLFITSQGQGGSQGVYKVKLNFPGRPY